MAVGEIVATRTVEAVALLCLVVEKSIEEQYSTNGSCRNCGSMNCACWLWQVQINYFNGNCNTNCGGYCQCSCVSRCICCCQCRLCLLVEKSIVNRSCRNRDSKNYEDRCAAVFGGWKMSDQWQLLKSLQLRMFACWIACGSDSCCSLKICSWTEIVDWVGKMAGN